MTHDLGTAKKIEPILLAAFLKGDEAAGDTICSLLQTAMQNATVRFLPDPEDRSDVVQESLIAVLKYVKGLETFEGNFLSFAVTVACNRSRDLLRWRQRHPNQVLDSLDEWIADESRNSLDILTDDEQYQLLSDGLRNIDKECRKLLTGLYLENETAEDFRRRAGLKSVQTIYYRRGLCLEKLLNYLQTRMEIRSSPGQHEEGTG